MPPNDHASSELPAFLLVDPPHSLRLEMPLQSFDDENLTQSENKEIEGQLLRK